MPGRTAKMCLLKNAQKEAGRFQQAVKPQASAEKGLVMILLKEPVLITLLN